jgi:hypothetical protein
LIADDTEFCTSKIGCGSPVKQEENHRSGAELWLAGEPLTVKLIFLIQGEKKSEENSFDKGNTPEFLRGHVFLF